MIRCYTDLIKLKTYEERFRYLQLNGGVGKDTFGFDRYLNQKFYRSAEWHKIKNEVIIRDGACDLGIEGRELNRFIFVHHMNPIKLDDVLNQTDFLLDPEYLICVSRETHNAIHYGDESNLFLGIKERTPNDTCPWRVSK